MSKDKTNCHNIVVDLHIIFYYFN